jgi:hypothetical protein
MANRITAGFQQGADQARLAAQRKGRRGGHQQKITLRKAAAQILERDPRLPGEDQRKPGAHAHDNGRSSSRAP